MVKEFLREHMEYLVLDLICLLGLIIAIVWMIQLGNKPMLIGYVLCMIVFLLISFSGWIRMYRPYKTLKELEKLDNNKDKEKIFLKNFQHCMDLGFSQEELLALLNLISSSKL